MRRTHGESNRNATPEYRAWISMHGRCYNPRNKKYLDYGARGITVCDRWMSYRNFLRDMGRRPTAQHSLGRINNDLGYGPANCRWETAQQQNGNRRTWARAVRINGLTVAEVAAREGVSKQTIYRRMYGSQWGKRAPA